jgi:hypothetical protein
MRLLHVNCEELKILVKLKIYLIHHNVSVCMHVYKTDT